MTVDLRVVTVAAALLFGLAPAEPAFAQKQGGILKTWSFDSPASMSILEESTIAALRPTMGVFNNLVLFDQHVKRNSLEGIVPELATGWSWNEEGTELTLPLQQGVKWHDGKPFTAKDVKCTWDLLTGKASEKLRINPRKSWYRNLDEVRVDGDYQVTFQLKRPQPSFLALLATGWSPIYPCHVPARDMRTHPIGTGPFKFIEYKPNQSITCRRKIEMSPGVQSRNDTPGRSKDKQRTCCSGRIDYDRRRAVKRRRALLRSTPSRNSRLETHSDGPGADRNWPAPATRR